MLKSVFEVRRHHDEMARTSLDSRKKNATESQCECAWNIGNVGKNDEHFLGGKGSCGGEIQIEKSSWERRHPGGGLGKEQASHAHHGHEFSSIRKNEKREYCTSSSNVISSEVGIIEISPRSEFGSTARTGSSGTLSNKENRQKSYRRRSSSIISRFCRCVKWQNGLFGVSGSMSGTTFSISEH